MKYTKPLNDSSYPARNGSYVDADASTGVIGSTVPGAAIEAPQREIVQVIEAAGLTPDDADRTQLLQALNSPWQIMDVSSVTRAGDNSITLTGDTTSIYPKGKRLRFNGADDYLCRVFGDPVYSGGITTVKVWFDARANVIPSSITKFERSRLTPQDTANGGSMSGTDDAATIETLRESFCCGAYWSE